MSQIFKVNEVKIEREDNLLMSIPSLTEIEENSFQIRYSSTVFQTYARKSIFTLYFYMNRDVSYVQR